MRQQVQTALGKRVFAHIQNKTTDRRDQVTRHAIGLYTCPQRWAHEQKQLFREHPIFITLSCQLAAPGAFITDDNTGVPLLIVRGHDGRARAFINACQHRGARLANGQGQVKRRFICPYHAWAFETDGQLTRLPHREDFSDFDFDSCRLEERPLAEAFGMIWVRPEGHDPIDVVAMLSGLEDDFAHFKFADYHPYEIRKIDVAMNWKLVIDTFLEPYHFAALHKATVAPIFIPNMCLFDAFGRNLREVFPRRSVASLADQPPEGWDFVYHSALVYVLFPNTVFVMQADHAEVWRIFPSPDGVDKAHMYLEFYIPEPVQSDKAKAHWDANMDLVCRTVLDEDFPVGEGAQKGFMSGAGRSHIVFGQNEPALAYFEETIAKAVIWET